jgi:hypothetical protein
MTAPSPHRSSGIDLRTALIVLASFLAAIIAGLLTYVAVGNWAAGVLAGGAALGGTVPLLDWLLTRNHLPAGHSPTGGPAAPVRWPA